MKRKENIPYFVASFLSNAYALNSWIPNTHLVFYNMFCSPKINKEERKSLEDKNLLAGNIFNHSVSSIGYKSLLHSVLITGKKKHLKKILSHMEEHLSKDEFSDQIIAKIIDVCITHDFPILLGNTISNYMSRGVKISKQNYMNFCLYLDRCKGLERETMRFMHAVNDTEHIQMDWDFVKPFFIRALNFKKGQDILELFEIIKGKLVLNKGNDKLPFDERNEILRNIKTTFYRSLIQELLARKAFSIADIIYIDYKNQIPQIDPNDLLGVKISCLKRDMTTFEDLFIRQLNLGNTNPIDRYKVLLSNNIAEAKD